jgi:hypothetical protein
MAQMGWILQEHREWMPSPSAGKYAERREVIPLDQVVQIRRAEVQMATDALHGLEGAAKIPRDPPQAGAISPRRSSVDAVELLSPHEPPLPAAVSGT